MRAFRELRSRFPKGPGEPGPEGRNDVEGQSEVSESSDMKKLPLLAALASNSTFAKDHLNKPPKSCARSITTKVNKHLAGKLKAATSESATYTPARDLLNNLSKTMWKAVSNRAKELSLDKCLGPIEFLDHHASPPTHYPYGKIEDKPDLVAVFPLPVHPPFHYPTTAGGTVTGIPHHRIVTLAESKGLGGPDAKPQAATYAAQHLRARPDHPGFYCLSIKPKGFEILYADSTGPHVSEVFSWDDLDVLAMYVYSLYDPPKGHILRDNSVTVVTSKKNPLGPATWNVLADGNWYQGANILFLGDPWSRRTTIFLYKWPSMRPAFHLIIKDYYRLKVRRYDEAELIDHIHKEGFVPGVVRLGWAGDVKDDEGEPMTSGEGDDLRIRRRLVILDVGEDLLQAKSVNNLLKVIYDVLEVHRLIAKRRDVLHRDMSLYNILMYPKWGKFRQHKLIKDPPPLIDDILGGKLRNSDEYQASCLLTDFDNSAMLNDSSEPNELTLRTGTPMYIARSVAAGRTWITRISFKYSKPMPNLIPEARTLYDKLHGPARYKLYEDTPGVTIHGGIPPPLSMDTTDLESPPGFRHKLEYDAESIFWTAAASLLQVQPAKEKDTAITCGNLKVMWTDFERHTIGERGVNRTDPREAAILDRMFPSYADAFLPCMRDIAALLFHMAQQVRPSYGLMSTPPPHDDHLHEALQRLILNYLVEHRDSDIELTPGVTRSTNGIPDSRGTKRTREIVAEELRGAKRRMRSKDSSMPPQVEHGFLPRYA